MVPPAHWVLAPTLTVMVEASMPDTSTVEPSSVSVAGGGTCPLMTISPPAHAHAINGATAATGGGQPHTHPLTNEAIPTLPSYQNLYFIIRVK